MKRVQWMTSLSVLGLGAVLAMGVFSRVPSFRFSIASPSSFALVLDSSSPMEEGKKKGMAKTSSGSPIEFYLDGYHPLDGAFGSLDPLGSISNIDPLHKITSLSVSFTGEATLEYGFACSFGYEYRAALSSGVTHSFEDGVTPTHIRISAGENPLTIDAIQIQYDCASVDDPNWDRYSFSWDDHSSEGSVKVKDSSISTAYIPFEKEGKPVHTLAYQGCYNKSNLSMVYLPEGLQTIGDYQFGGSKVTIVQVPESVTYLHPVGDKRHVLFRGSTYAGTNNPFFDITPKSVTYSVANLIDEEYALVNDLQERYLVYLGTGQAPESYRGLPVRSPSK
ncbi:MAG: hypothetical protein SOV58_04780 [Candidatus Enteromonas sp.]|nr:hypothetical protein [Candidatus Enteromonas sp.]